jgi:hypothetical protein
MSNLDGLEIIAFGVPLRLSRPDRSRLGPIFQRSVALRDSTIRGFGERPNRKLAHRLTLLMVISRALLKGRSCPCAMKSVTGVVPRWVFDLYRCRGAASGPSAAIKRAESEVAPKTPPCMWIILNEASQFPLSVAPVQSVSSRHSNPRSFASRIVV